MRNSSSVKIGLTLGIITLFILSALTPIAFGSNIRTTVNESIVEDYNFDRHLYPEYYDSYSVDEISENVKHYITNNEETIQDISNSEVITYKETFEPINGPMDSPWPMYCHDTRHTGRSPYSTTNNLGIEKWRFGTNGWVEGGPVIDNDGTIYVGAKDLYALYPNGTLKWEYDTPYYIMSTPAIDENGVIYVGTIWAHPNYLYAIHSSNGTIKWKYQTGDDVYSSPSISDDGTIYFCDSGNWQIKALYPNGTLRWSYKTNHVVYSSPAIGDDGTVYCGSHDGNLYALFPNNGTLKWKFGTGDWVARGACIADDGTVYFGSWDGYLYACYPNGTLKWKTGGYLCGTTPIIGNDGTIYVGNKQLSAIYPENGTVKWAFTLEQNEDIRGSNPCISADGTIYFGTFEGGRIYAVNNDGTEKWHKSLGGDVLSAPAIGEDGTVYIGSNIERLYAFGYPGPNPLAPDINGPTSGKPGTPLTYTFTSTDPDGDQVSYYVDWGDGDITDWTDFQPSGDSYSESHTWTTQGTYVIRAKAKDTEGYESDWGELEVTMPRNKASYNSLFLRFLERFLILEEFISRMINPLR